MIINKGKEISSRLIINISEYNDNDSETKSGVNNKDIISVVLVNMAIRNEERVKL